MPELARKVGISQRSAWFVMHRLIHVLGEAQAEDLFGVVEADETFLGGKGHSGGGRPDNHATVLGAVERRGDELGRIRLTVLSDRAGETIEDPLRPGLEPGSELWTDGWRAYPKVQEVDHGPISDAEAIAPGPQIPLIHIVFANLKNVVWGVHSWWSPAKLPAFLDLFACRFNHREDLQAGFEEVLGLLVSSRPVGCAGLGGGRN